MKRFKLAVFVCVFLFAALAFGQTNRWVSDGSEVVMKPDDVVIDVVEVDDIDDSWGGSYLIPPNSYQKIMDTDGAKWIGIDEEGYDETYTGYFIYRKNLGCMLPSGNTHSRITFWGCADDSIVSVALFDNLVQEVQPFYPDRGHSHMTRLVRIDMTDADLVPGWEYYDLLVTVKNEERNLTGLIFYISIDYDDTDQMFFYNWQAGWSVHSLPFRPTSAYDQLIDLFPYAFSAMYWEQESSSWQYLSLTAPLIDELGDIVRSHSFFVLHTDPGARLARGYPIYEQRYHDIWPGSGVSQFRDIGTVACNIPFDCTAPVFEPDDLPNESIDTAWFYNQSSGFQVTDEIDAFGSSPNAIGYRMHCYPPSPYSRCHVDLRCFSSVSTSTSIESRRMSDDVKDRIIQFKKENGYDIYSISDEYADTATTESSFDEVVRLPLDHEVMPLPPGYFFKTTTNVSISHQLSVSAYPNPFNSTVQINVILPDETEDVSVTIYDINGKMIKDLTSTTGKTFLWNGTDQRGEECPSGAYLYKVICGDESVTDRILFVE